MSEKTGDLDKELHDYGTSTDGPSTTGTTVSEGNDGADNPVGFDADADRAEESSVESLDEGERSSVEEI